jgi:hypothetical protein
LSLGALGRGATVVATLLLVGSIAWWAGPRVDVTWAQGLRLAALPWMLLVWVWCRRRDWIRQDPQRVCGAWIGGFGLGTVAFLATYLGAVSADVWIRQAALCSSVIAGVPGSIAGLYHPELLEWVRGRG